MHNLHKCFCTLIICILLWLPTCKLTEIEVSNIIYYMVLAKFSWQTKFHGVPNFMEGSLISCEIGDPRVPKILGNWGPRSLISYDNGDPGSPFLGMGSPFSLHTRIQLKTAICLHTQQPFNPLVRSFSELGLLIDPKVMHPWPIPFPLSGQTKPQLCQSSAIA